MTGAVIAFGIAIGMALFRCRRLMTRLPKRRLINRSSTDRSGPISDNDASDAGSHFARSAGENSASKHSGAPSDSGGSDGEGGSDAGDGADGSGSGSD
jgi:hypothetical protein